MFSLLVEAFFDFFQFVLHVSRHHTVVSALVELTSSSHVVLILDLVADLGQFVILEKRQEVPGDVQGFEDGSVFVVTLVHKLGFVSVMELKVELVILRKGFFSNDGLHGHSILTHGVESIQLIGHIGVIVSGHFFIGLAIFSFMNTDSVLHESGKGGQHIDGRIDTLLEHSSVDVDLAFGDVSSKIWNWVGDVIVWHGQNWNLGDGTKFSLHSSGSLIDGRQISVHVTWVSSSTWHFFSGGRDFSQGVGVRSHVGQNGEHVHFFFVSQMLSGSEGKSGGDDSLNCGVVCVVHEEHSSVHGSVHLEVSLEETSCLHVDSHCREDNSEVFFGVIKHILMLDQSGLSTNLGSNIIMGETSCRKERNLLSSSNRSVDINS